MQWQVWGITLGVALALLALTSGRVRTATVALGEMTSRGGERIEDISAGQLVWLRVEVTRDPPDLPVEYAWKVGKGGKIEAPTDKEPAGFYQATAEPGTTFVTLVVLLKGKELDQKTFPLRIVGPKEPPPLDKGMGPMQRSGEDAVQIQRPRAGERVVNIITVEGTVRTLYAEERLTLLARPVPAQPGYAWWVQAPPVVRAQGNIWTSSPVHIGLPGDRGLPFQICAVITVRSLSTAEQLLDLPPGPRFCVDVERE